jgi:cell division protein FtsB
MTTPSSVTPGDNQSRTGRRAPIIIFVLIGLLVLFAVSYVQRMAAKEAVDAQIVQLQADIQRAEHVHAVLLDEQEKVNDAAHIAAVARDDLGFMQEGDKPIVVIDAPVAPTPLPATGTSTARTPVRTEPNWRQWLDLLAPGVHP